MISDRDFKRKQYTVEEPKPSLGEPYISIAAALQNCELDQVQPQDTYHARSWLYKKIEELRKKPYVCPAAWPSNEDEALIAMWKKGYTVSEIAVKMKKSRNAISGKIVRLRNKYGADVVHERGSPLGIPLA